MTVAVAVLGVLVALLALFVVALLRSHAELLRRLARVEAAVDGKAVTAVPNGEPHELSNTTNDGPAYDLAGVTPAGDSVKLSLGPGSPRTLLAFLGTGCHACVPLWDALHGDQLPAPTGARLVVVTKGAERERVERLLELAPDGVEVVMSTPAWHDYEVPGTPHFVLVRDGYIAGRGAATSWQQIDGFLTDAQDDDRLHRSRSLDTNARAARAEQALARAGITPDHPSLYPSRESDR